MNSYQSVITTLRENGYRLTTARKKILEIIFSLKKPVSANQLHQLLESKNLSVNQSTIYRELAFLTEQGIAAEVNIDAKETFYEQANLPHHHHLVCNGCGDIQDIHSEKIEKAVHHYIDKVGLDGFEVETHDIELYGRCAPCQQKVQL